MKLHRQRPRDNLRINLTPLIDMVFLLLMFFMLTTTFNRPSQLEIDLPTTENQEEAEEQPQPIRIVLDAEGRYAINDDAPLADNQLETLRSALQSQRNADSRDNPPLMISADAQATHQLVMRAMEAARDAGFVSLSFETQAQSSER